MRRPPRRFSQHDERRIASRAPVRQVRVRQAAAVAFAAGGLDGYVWNGRRTFAGGSSRAGIARYGVVQGTGLSAGAGLVWLLGAIGICHLAA